MSQRTDVEFSRGKLREVEASAQSTITDIRAILDQIQAEGGRGTVELSHLLEQAVTSLQECAAVISTLQETHEKSGMDFVSERQDGSASALYVYSTRMRVAPGRIERVGEWLEGIRQIEYTDASGYALLLTAKKYIRSAGQQMDLRDVMADLKSAHDILRTMQECDRFSADLEDLRNGLKTYRRELGWAAGHQMHLDGQSPAHIFAINPDHLPPGHIHTPGEQEIER